MARLLARFVTDLRLVLGAAPEADGPPEQHPGVRRFARGVSEVYAVMAVGVAIWVVYLAVALPERSTAQHYDITWVGFDVLLMVAMIGTAVNAARLDPRVQLAANATATLLIVDAWMDVTTAPTPATCATAVAMALFLELPLAVLSLRIAHSVNRRVTEHAAAVMLASAEARVPERASAA